MKKISLLILLLCLLMTGSAVMESQLPSTADYDKAYRTWNKRFAPAQEDYGYGMALYFYSLIFPATINPPELLEYANLSEGNKRHAILTFEKFTFEVVRDWGITITVSFESASDSPDLNWAKALMFSYVPSFADVEGIPESFKTSIHLSPQDVVYSHVPSKYMWLNYTISKTGASFTHKIDVVSSL